MSLWGLARRIGTHYRSVRFSFVGVGKMTDLDVVVIGAGPYGLAAGAHLKAAGLGLCVFGEPMDFWARKMPEGMLLRSPRVASNISDPYNKLTLDAYEWDRGIQS